ncbi:MAG: hypothetical protein ACPG7F_00480 [Aggregatilineales bacterium]
MSDTQTILIVGSDDCCEEMLDTLLCHTRCAWYMNYQFVVDGRNAVSADALMHCKKWNAPVQVMSNPNAIITALKTGQIQRVVLLEMASVYTFRLAHIEKTAKQHGIEVVTQVFS